MKSIALLSIIVLLLVLSCNQVSTTSPKLAAAYCDTLVIHEYEAPPKNVLSFEEKCVIEKLEKMNVGQYIWLKRELFRSDAFISEIRKSDSLKSKYFNAAEHEYDPIQYNKEETCLKLYRLR